MADEGIDTKEVAGVAGLSGSLVRRSCDSRIFFSESEIFGVTDQNWLINNSLHLSLGRGGVGGSEDLHLVGGLDLDTSVLGVLVVEGGEETIVIETVVSSVLHELDVLLVSVTGGSSLGSISHDGDLLVGVFILDDDGGGYWVEVGGDVIGVLHVVVLSVPEFLVVHVETVGIDPQVVVGGEFVKELPVNDDIFASFLIVLLFVEFLLLISNVVSDWDLVEGDLELHEVGKLGELDDGADTGLDWCLGSLVLGDRLGSLVFLLLESDQELSGMISLSDLDAFNLRVKLGGTIQSSEFVSTIALTFTLIGLIVSWGHDELLAHVGGVIEVLEDGDDRSANLSGVSSNFIGSSVGPSIFLLSLLHQTNILQFLMSIFERLSKSGIEEVRLGGGSSINFDSRLNQLIWNMGFVLGFTEILDEVDMVVLISVEFDGERNHVFDDSVLAVEHNLWGEVVEINMVLSTVVVETEEFELAVRNLGLEELFVGLVGRVLNNHQKFRLGVVWRVVLVVDLSGEDTSIKSIELDIMLLLQFSCENFGVELLDLLEERVGLLEEVITDERDRCSCDGVMMLEDTQVLKHLSLALNDLLGVFLVVRNGVLGLESQRGVKLGTGQFNHSLDVRLGGEETTPVLIRILRVWESIISPESKALRKRIGVLRSIGNIIIIGLLHSLNELLWVRVNKLDVWVDAVPVLHNSVEEEVVDLSLGERKVASIGHVDIISILIVNESLDNLSEMLHLLHALFVELGIFLVEGNVVVIVLIECETLWPAILSLLLGHEETEDIFLGAEVFLSWSPDFHLLVLLDKLHLLIKVNSGEEHSIETDILGQSSITIGYTEGVDLPTDVW